MQQIERRARQVRRHRRQVALQVYHRVLLAVAIEVHQRLVNAVGAGGMIGPRHDRFAARRRHRLGNFTLGAGHRHAAQIRLLGAAHHMDDHRHAGDIGEWLVGQTHRLETRRNQNNGIDRAAPRRRPAVAHGSTHAASLL